MLIINLKHRLILLMYQTTKHHQLIAVNCWKQASPRHLVGFSALKTSLLNLLENFKKSHNPQRSHDICTVKKKYQSSLTSIFKCVFTYSQPFETDSHSSQRQLSHCQLTLDYFVTETVAIVPSYKSRSASDM